VKGKRKTIINDKILSFLNALAYKNRKTITHKTGINGKNNTILNKGNCKEIIFDVSGDNNEIFIGFNTSLRDRVFYIRGNGHKVIIGENCQFGEIEIWIEDHNCSIFIENGVTIQQAKISVTEPFSILRIQKDCMISNNVEIRTGDSHSIIDIQTGVRINKAANVTLKKHVWLGAHTKVLKGVTIEENSIIGTGSVVTSDITANSIAVGIPAKVVRSGINWDRKRIYDY